MILVAYDNNAFSTCSKGEGVAESLGSAASKFPGPGFLCLRVLEELAKVCTRPEVLQGWLEE